MYIDARCEHRGRSYGTFVGYSPFLPYQIEDNAQLIGLSLLASVPSPCVARHCSRHCQGRLNDIDKNQLQCFPSSLNVGVINEAPEHFAAFRGVNVHYS